MLRRAAALAVLSLITAAAAAQAQSRPDFSGTWSLPAEAPLLANGKPAPAPGYGALINIVHARDTITISRIVGGQTLHTVHPIDGSETRTAVSGRVCEAEVNYVWRAEWKESALALTQVGAWRAGATAMTTIELQTILRQPAADTLLVELNVRNAGTTERQTRSTRYVRTGPPAAVPAAAASPVAKAKIDQLAWLGGNWLGTAEDTVSEERWTSPAGGVMMATSRTIRSGVISDFEFLCIVERGGGLVYQAMPNGRQPATDFTLTKAVDGSATFENPDHDFPKMIQYTLGANDTLEAVVSGSAGQKPIVVRFRRQKP
jgi:hypothetical protein